MRRNIYIFRRGGEYLAELHLDLCPAYITVEDWGWKGDSSAQKLVAPLPQNKGEYLSVWFIRIEEAAEREGLELTGEYVGEPEVRGQDYFPSPETIAHMEKVGEELDAVYGKAPGY